MRNVKHEGPNGLRSRGKSRGMPRSRRTLVLSREGMNAKEECERGLDSISHWRIVRGMIFTETPVFTRQIAKLLPDDEYRELQQELILNPAAGNIIRHSGGLRKVRWRSATKGKRGGLRVIYYWYVSSREIYMLLAYGKGEKDDLTAKEVKVLRELVEEAMS